jgi:hypothetical protein
MISPVDQGNPNWSVIERFGRVQTAKSATDDDNMRSPIVLV